jgi:hypothetical protein
MTYLDLVNNVLKRLRERTVATVEANTYSTLIGILLNDAKKEVEDSWDWSALRTTLTATTEENTFSYVLTGAGNRPTLLNVINDTDNFLLKYKDPKWFDQQFLMTDTVEKGSPCYYTFNGQDSNGDTIIELFPKPDGIYNIRFNLVLRTSELEEDSDELFVPTHPVAQLTYAKAVEERGEDGGVSSSSAYATAQRSLSDSIAMDAQKHEEELIWQEV